MPAAARHVRLNHCHILEHHAAGMMGHYEVT
jgi:FtsP/CotA-like multicopper oxidase with cupredoxin domain